MKTLSVGLLALFLLPACSHQAAPVATPTNLLAAEGFYVDLARLGAMDFAPPPAAGSTADKADLATLERWQKVRTSAECARAASEVKANYDTMFGKISPFPEPLDEATKAFLAHVRDDSANAVTLLKKRFNRPRPFNRDTALEPCVKHEPSLAYPSGHATIARVFAHVLAELVPARKREFFRRANEVALDRVIAGVHHPTDIAAGKRFGDAIYEALTRRPSYQASVAALRTHLAQ